MKPLRYGVFAMMVALTAIAHTQTVKAGDQFPAKERFIGAWHLAQIDSPRPRWKIHQRPAAQRHADLHARWPCVGPAYVSEVGERSEQ